MKTYFAYFLDALSIAFVGVWLAGGIPWQGRVLLKHGADPRRAALIIALVALLIPWTRDRSVVVKLMRVCAKGLRDPLWRWSLLVVVFAWSAALGICQAFALGFPLYDVGIFHQILWGISNGHGFVSTISGAGNFLRDHSSVSLAVLAPFFKLTNDSPLVLPVLHAALIWGGAAAWLYLAERIPHATEQLKAKVAAAASVFIVSFDSLWGNLRWGFHENSIAFAASSWALALLFTGRKLLVLPLLLLAAGSKEILLLDVAMAFLIWAMLEGEAAQGRERIIKVAGLFAVAFSLVLLFVGFESLPHPPDKNYFMRYYSYLGLDLRSFVMNAFLDPWHIVETIGVRELARYFGAVFVPWLMLPFAWWIWSMKGWASAGGRTSWIHALCISIILPSFLSSAIATYPPLRQSGFHYVLELWPVLAVLTVLALPKLDRWFHGRLPWVWALLALLALDNDPWNKMREYWSRAKAVSSARQAIWALPLGESVAADELAGTWVSGRLKVSRWPDLSPFENGCPNWVVIPDSRPAPSGCSSVEKPLKVWSTGGWSGYRLKN